MFRVKALIWCICEVRQMHFLLWNTFLDFAYLTVRNISGSRVKMMRYLEIVNYKYFTTHCLKPIPVLEKGKAGESSSMVDQIGGT